MATPVTMPVLGLTMEEGTVAEWLKREGDAIQKDEPLLTVEMDKGTVEVPSPTSGVLQRIVVQPGTTVPVRTLIAEIAESGAELAQPRTDGGRPVADAGGAAIRGGQDANAAVAPRPTRAPGAAGGHGDLPPVEASREQMAAAETANAVGGEPARAGTGAGAERRLFVSPRARLRARDLGIDLGSLRGSGPHGRILEADVLAVAGERRPPTSPHPGPLAEGDGVLPLTRLRRITAERMLASAQSTARVTLFLEAEFSEVARFRAQLEPEFARLGVTRLPWDAIIARAAALALKDHPAVLAQWVDGRGLRQAGGIHVGVAVTLEPEGLVVPVLRDADRRSLRELAADLLDLVAKARSGRLSPTEMEGGSFSITNLGGYRVDGFTPILNPPETAILGVGRIAEKPVVIEGALHVRTQSTLSLSFDHRVVDGAPAAAFLARLAELLERPYALLGI